MNTEHTATTGQQPGPDELGVGMRFSIHPHCDDFARVILDSLAEAEAGGLTEHLEITTDEVSTYVGARQAPAEQHLARYLAGVIAAASRHSGGGHIASHVLLSRGCPGEVSCDLSVTGLGQAAPVQVPATGIDAVAHWSLYPLLDGGSEDGDHMPIIENAIACAQQRGTATRSVHYATTLSGDVAEVLTTAVDAWTEVGTAVPHVVSHLTISVGSPTAGRV